MGTFIAETADTDHYTGPEEVVGFAEARRRNALTAYANDKDLRAFDLRGTNFAGMCLTEANLSSANLRRVDLTDAVLSKADLTGACLRDADLTRASLRSADLSFAILANAYLFEADLSDADLSGVNLSSTIMHRVRYNAATIWPKGFIATRMNCQLGGYESFVLLESPQPSSFHGPRAALIAAIDGSPGWDLSIAADEVIKRLNDKINEMVVLAKENASLRAAMTAIKERGADDAATEAAEIAESRMRAVERAIKERELDSGATAAAETAELRKQLADHKTCDGTCFYAVLAKSAEEEMIAERDRWRTTACSLAESLADTVAKLAR